MVLKNCSESGYYVTQRQWTPTKPRAPISSDFQTPGPGSFNLPATIGKNANQVVKGNSPSFSFGSKIDDKRPDFVPGVGAYNIAGLSERGKDSCQAPTISPKIEEKVDNFVPGPGSYNISGLSEKGKDVCNAPTIAAKLKEPAPFKTPAPGAYNPEKSDIVTQGTAPKYTFGAKLKEHAPDDIPAPGRYNPPAPEAYKKKSPSYTLSYRTNIPCDNTKKPGPGQYTPEKVFMNKQSSPRFSFGIRHSPCAESK